MAHLTFRIEVVKHEYEGSRRDEQGTQLVERQKSARREEEASGARVEVESVLEAAGR